MVGDPAESELTTRDKSLSHILLMGWEVGRPRPPYAGIAQR